MEIETYLVIIIVILICILSVLKGIQNILKDIRMYNKTSTEQNKYINN